MPQVVGEDGELLNATYQVGTVLDLPGLILESRSGSDRNPDYGKALITLLKRYWLTDLSTISVFVVSKLMLKSYTQLPDLAVKIDGQHPIKTAGRSPAETYHLIGRAQEKLRSPDSPIAKGGNRTKRIMLHHPTLSTQAWHQLATLAQWHDEDPVDDSFTIGRHKPTVEFRTALVHQRSAKVVDYVLGQADGQCEACFQPAPFLRDDGSPYLEVHHVLPLADGGSDLVSNAIAVCPNCHRRFHSGNDRAALVTTVLGKISRLKDERK